MTRMPSVWVCVFLLFQYYIGIFWNVDHPLIPQILTNKGPKKTLKNFLILGAVEVRFIVSLDKKIAHPVEKRPQGGYNVAVDEH